MLLKRFQLVALSCVMVMLAACQHDSVALYSSTRLAWPGVEENIHRGVDDGIEDGDLDAEGAQDLAALEVLLEGAIFDDVQAGWAAWDGLSPWAHRGVEDLLEDGMIGPGVRASLLERLRLFTDSVHALMEDR